MIAKNPRNHYIAALLDVDDFKLINDVYGHTYGDRALKNLADSMKKFFPSDVLLGRNGGDEFCVLIPNCTYEEAKEKLTQFTKTPKTFLYKGEETSVYKGYKQDKIEMRGDRAEMSDFPLYLNMVAGGLDCRDQAIGGFSFVVKIYAVPVVEIIG